MLKKIAIVLVVVLGALAGYASTRPSEFLVAREVTVQAQASKIFPFINNAKQMDRWMPWAEVDKAMKMSYSGPASGVGSQASWTSTGQMGVGSSTIIESVPGKKAKFDLRYEKPFKMNQVAEITIRPSGAQSIVRWSVTGKNSFFCKLMSIFMNMDKMVGDSFEKGLAKLKTLAESA